MEQTQQDNPTARVLLSKEGKMEENFLAREECKRCKGPISSRPIITRTFDEKTLDYIQQTVWVCYACGKEHALDSQPYYVM
jgi:RNase P subunit RPR2